MSLQTHSRHDPELAALGPWFHNLHLPDGRQTAPDHPLGDFPAFKWRQLAPALPDDLSGWRALDIGCNAGFYSFELARHGADVVAIDTDEHYLRQARWASALYGSVDEIEFRRADVYDLGRWSETFDLVLFMGVLYHLRYPLLGLDIVAEATGHLLVLQTLTTPGPETLTPPDDLPLEKRERLREPGWPTLAFIERSLAGDATNWWAPNHAAVEAMLRSAGLEVLACPVDELYICRPSRVPPRRGEVAAALGRRACPQAEVRDAGREPRAAT
jgi:tRNA (mo5U34)-methyltransferase